MDIETSLFVSDSDTPTVPLGSARCLAELDAEGIILCYSSTSGGISMSMSKDRGGVWAAPLALVSDGSRQFTIVKGQGQIYLLYVSSGKSLKLLTIRPDNPLKQEDEQIIYMYHEETGEPAFPAAYIDELGILHLVSTFRKSDGWSVLYRRTDEDGWQPWEEVASGQGLSACYSNISGVRDSVHILYRLNVDGRYQLFHRRKTGESWSEPCQLTFSDGHNGTPVMETDGNTIYCSWVRTGNRGDSMIFRRYDSDGWSPELRLSSDDEREYGPPTISQRNGALALCWNKGPDLVLRSSFDRGRSWSEERTVETGGRVAYPKSGATRVSDNGNLELVAAWTKNSYGLWGATGGVETARLSIDTSGELGPLIIGKVSQNPPRMKIIDVKQDDIIKGNVPRAVNIKIDDKPEPITLRNDDEGYKEALNERFSDYEGRLGYIQGQFSLFDERTSLKIERMSTELEAVKKELAALKSRMSAAEGRITKPAQSVQAPLRPSVKPEVTVRAGGAEVGTVRFKENRPVRSVSDVKRNHNELNPKSSVPLEKNDGNVSILRRIFGFGKKG